MNPRPVLKSGQWKQRCLQLRTPHNNETYAGAKKHASSFYPSDKTIPYKHTRTHTSSFDGTLATEAPLRKKTCFRWWLRTVNREAEAAAMSFVRECVSKIALKST